MRFLVFLLLLAPVAFAQSITGVTGSVVDGEQITILGGPFGTKGNAAPVIFTDFNEGIAETAVDSLESVHGWRSWGAGDDDPARYSNEALRDSEGMNCRFIYPDRISGSGLSDDMVQDGLDIDAGDRVYLSMYIWSTYTGCQVEGVDPQQWKIFRFSHGNNGYPALVFLWHGAGLTPPGTSKVFSYQGSGGGGEDEARYLPGETPAPIETWWHFEIEAQVSSGPGQSDGVSRAWYNGELRVDESDWTYLHPDDDPNDVWNWIMIGQYIQRPPWEYVVRYDDVYIDKSWARVVLADSPNWNNSTHRELQIPTSWNSNAISVTVNSGTFQPGQTAYLFVVDPDGQRIGGEEVVIGGEIQDDGVPGQPSTVLFQQIQ